MIAAIGGNAAHSADRHLVGVEIVSLEPTAFARANGEVVPTDAVGERELTRNLPSVLHEQAVFPFAAGQLAVVERQEILVHRGRLTQQESGIAIELVRR